MMLPEFGLLRPATVEEALEVIDEDHVPFVGGTELLLAMKVGMLMPEALVDLGRIAEMGAIRADGDELAIGAAVSHSRISDSPDVQRRSPLLADVERAVGNARVRAQGTIGGNLCFAEPKSDLATTLIALDARVVLRGPDGRREVRVADFVEGPYTTTRGDHELLTEVRVPPSDKRGAYRKFQTMERPTVGVAAAAGPDGATVVVGAVGPTPVRVDFDSVEAIDVDEVVDLLEPTPDLTGSEDYKRHVAGQVIGRALEGIA